MVGGIGLDTTTQRRHSMSTETVIRRGSMTAADIERRRALIREEMRRASEDHARETAWLDERMDWLRQHPGATIDDYEAQAA